MARGLWVVLMLIAGSVAGCLQPSDASDVEAASTETPLDPPSALAVSLDAAPAPSVVILAEGDPWWLTTVASTSEGAITSSWWDIPNGSLVPWAMNEDFDTYDQVYALEVVPIVPAGAAIDLLGFVFFTEEKGALSVNGGMLRFEETLTQYDLTGTAMEEVIPVETGGEFVTLWDAADASRVALVAFARSAEPIEIGFAWRVMDHDPTHWDGDEEPVADLEAFRMARNGSRPLALPATTAIGAAMDAYFDSIDSLSQTVVTSTVGSVTVEEVAGPRTSTRTVSLSVAKGLDHGWGLFDAGFFGLDVGVSRWAAAANVWGEGIEGGGVTAEAGPTLFVPAPIFLSASAGVFVLGEGDGGIEGSLQVDRATAPGLFSGVSMGRIEFGATLMDLFGVPSATESYVSPELPLFERSEGGGEFKFMLRGRPVIR